MKKINLSITGCLGRMGQELIKSTKKNKLFRIKSITAVSYTHLTLPTIYSV